MGGVAALDSAQTDLFARRMTRLEEVTRLLIGVRREHTQACMTQVQQKARIYEDNMQVSHGERQGIASAQTADIALQVLQLKGQIDVLEDERRFLEFCVQWVAT